jgi:hypothetical protein
MGNQIAHIDKNLEDQPINRTHGKQSTILRG